MEAAFSVRTAEAAAPHAEELLELPVEVQTREHPDGFPLHELLHAVQQKLPSATGMVMRGGKVFLKHGTQPTAEDREKLQELLRDPKRLLAMRQPPKPASSAMQGEDLEKFLLDDETPDTEWLRAFRRYAVTHLIKRKKAPK